MMMRMKILLLAVFLVTIAGAIADSDKKPAPKEDNAAIKASVKEEDPKKTPKSEDPKKTVDKEEDKKKDQDKGEEKDEDEGKNDEIMEAFEKLDDDIKKEMKEDDEVKEALEQLDNDVKQSLEKKAMDAEVADDDIQEVTALSEEYEQDDAKNDPKPWGRRRRRRRRRWIRIRARRVWTGIKRIGGTVARWVTSAVRLYGKYKHYIDCARKLASLARLAGDEEEYKIQMQEVADAAVKQADNPELDDQTLFGDKSPAGENDEDVETLDSGEEVADEDDEDAEATESDAKSDAKPFWRRRRRRRRRYRRPRVVANVAKKVCKYVNKYGWVITAASVAG